MKIVSPNTAYEELKNGHVRWTVQERDYYRDSSGFWLEPDMTREKTVNGWRIFRSSHIACGIRATTGEVTIAERRDINKRIKFDFGIPIPTEGIITHRHRVDIRRDIAQWGAGSGFQLTVHPRGIKLLIKFTDPALIPPQVSFGLAAQGLALDGRKVTDNGRQVFHMPNLIAWAVGNEGELVDVAESFNNGVVTLDLSKVRARFAGTSKTVIVDPSFFIQPANADSVLVSGAPTTNFSTLDYIAPGVNATAQIGRGILRFDLSSIAGTVTSADLQLYYNGTFFANNPNGRGYSPLLLRVLRNWVNNQVTWNEWGAGSSWTTAGAGSDGNDHTTTNVSTCDTAITTLGWYHWTDSGVIAQVQLTAGGNWDFLLVRGTLPEDTGDRSQPKFWSSDYVIDTSLRPKLDIVTLLASSVPFIIPPWLGGEVLQ